MVLDDLSLMRYRGVATVDKKRSRTLRGRVSRIRQLGHVLQAGRRSRVCRRSNDFVRLAGFVGFTALDFQQERYIGRE